MPRPWIRGTGHTQAQPPLLSLQWQWQGVVPRASPPRPHSNVSMTPVAHQHQHGNGPAAGACHHQQKHCNPVPWWQQPACHPSQPPTRGLAPPPPSQRRHRLPPGAPDRPRCRAHSGPVVRAASLAPKNTVTSGTCSFVGSNSSKTSFSISLAQRVLYPPKPRFTTSIYTVHTWRRWQRGAQPHW